MEEGSSGGVGGAASSSGSTLLCGGGRQRFEVELKPGETTIVSWKKLIKDANKAAKKNDDNKASPVSAPPPVPLPVPANPALDSRIAPPPTDPAENEGNDAPGGSRFSAVIEKIERLYMGKNSSDEEDLNDVPDDDEYDTEDSFIDDTELDEYFQVDNSAVKHDGFFVNRGKLERTNETIAVPTEQPKKRRRKDTIKGDNGSNDGTNNTPNKQMKVNKKESRKVVAPIPIDKNAPTPSRNTTLPDDIKYQSPIIALGTVVKKPSDSKVDSSPIMVLDHEAKLKQKALLQSKKLAAKLKEGSSSPVVVSQKVNEKSVDVQIKCHGQLVSNLEEVNRSVLPKEKIVHQQVDMKASEITPQPKNINMARKEGSSTKPKSTNLMLEKAIRDLEKIVAETRPPSMEVPEADNSAQAVKRRMPPEIKQKLAKVARLAHAIHGKLSKELLNRLMSILGHLIQIRSLKRNLHNMVSMGLSAKEEKDARVQQLKKEVDNMVKTRAPMMKPEAIEQQAGSSDDFQDSSSKKEKNLKSNFITDDALEDKLCDLYDLFVEGLDEDAAPQIRKFYAELAEMWPKGHMDTHGIKRAIVMSKDRKKALNKRKDQENMKRKKLLVSKTDTISEDPTTAVLVPHAPEKPTTATSATTTDRPKQDKSKGISVNQTDINELAKKKAKKRVEPELESSDDKRKAYKQMASNLVKPVTTESMIPVPESVIPVQAAVNRPADLA